MKTLSRGDGSGWIAEFNDEKALMEAVRSMLESDIVKWDAFAPYPCDAVRLASMRHGVGRRRLLTTFGVGGGIVGALAVLLWLYASQYAFADVLVNQGRAQGWDVWFAYVPPVFEGILLGAGLCLAAGFLVQARLPRWFDWLFADSALCRKATSLSYFIVVDGSHGDKGKEILNALGPVHMEWVEVPEQDGGEAHG